VISSETRRANDGVHNSIWRAVFERDRGRCQYCGEDLLAEFSRYWCATVDHVEAVAVNGGDAAENLVLACPACNGMLSRASHLKTFDERREHVHGRRKAEQAGFERWVRELRTDVAEFRFPDPVLRLLKTYDSADLRWDSDVDRHAIALEVVLRGDDEARRWLAQRLSPMELRDLIRQFAGTGCNEPDRAKLRQEFKLTEEEIPPRPYVGCCSADAT
jgi:hypothetical protein